MMNLACNNVDLYAHTSIGVTTGATTTTAATATSLQTDPDLYALHSKRWNSSSGSQINNMLHMKQNSRDNLLSTNRLAYVEALVDINAVVIESVWYNNSNIPKESNRVSPVVPLRTFIQEVLKRSKTTYSTLQTALFYLFRARPAIIQHLQQQTCDNITKKTCNNYHWQQNAYINCGRRMFLASLVVASKFVQDKTYRNSAWAKIAGLPVTEINTAERYFLNILDYRLFIDQDKFDHWHRLLHIRTQARMHNIPTSLRDLLSCLSFAPTLVKENVEQVPSTAATYTNNVLLPSSSPLQHNHHKPPFLFINTSLSNSYSPNPPSLSASSSLPSSISSSPAQTPTLTISPVRCQKRKFDAKDHVAIMDKKHCRFWQ